ncbi:M23 family metallopeptidase [Oscillatoria sp. FACHB-1406]|uniref:LysM peptidoglycan-binding domain-containing M23 family metallopeptidase n=1 Tax=Oscillatoria sp. FACHB-1406 TaxID=2692846 RepID=UPI0018EFEA0A|nr:M23 family metallopeptidase [Oscillatoria sp. FACHB-1406]
MSSAIPVRGQDSSTCPSPVLSRLQRHRVVSGETLDAIARQYNLIPETLTRFNPNLGRGSLPVGREVIVPPMNGMRVQAPRGSTWKDLAAAYGVRADILFELNGCTEKPNVVFIPGINWSSSGGSSRGRDYLGLAGYPLANRATIGFSYGWQTDAATEVRRFHSGIDLLAELGTSVLAADTGTVAFAGQQGNYGNLVIISHAGNLQTRYAHLEQVTVEVGQQVRAGQTIGTVGTTGQPDIASPHLHFEVRQQSSAGWVARDPEVYLKEEL